MIKWILYFAVFGITLSCQKHKQMNATPSLQVKDCLPDRKDVSKEEDVTGAVILVADQYILLSDDGNSRYLACNMPEAFQKEGLKVKFSLVVKEIFPTERLMATPAYLTKIE